MKTIYWLTMLAACMLTALPAAGQLYRPGESVCADYTSDTSIYAGDGFDGARCTYDGVYLYGRVKLVADFPDFKVQIVDRFPDLKVQSVADFPDACGRWQFVDDDPDFTIMYVNDFPDFKIKFVDSFPGT